MLTIKIITMSTRQRRQPMGSSETSIDYLATSSRRDIVIIICLDQPVYTYMYTVYMYVIIIGI